MTGRLANLHGKIVAWIYEVHWSAWAFFWGGFFEGDKPDIQVKDHIYHMQKVQDFWSMIPFEWHTCLGQIHAKVPLVFQTFYFINTAVYLLSTFYCGCLIWKHQLDVCTHSTEHFNSFALLVDYIQYGGGIVGLSCSCVYTKGIKSVTHSLPEANIATENMPPQKRT